MRHKNVIKKAFLKSLPVLAGQEKRKTAEPTPRCLSYRFLHIAFLIRTAKTAVTTITRIGPSPKLPFAKDPSVARTEIGTAAVFATTFPHDFSIYAGLWKEDFTCCRNRSAIGVNV